MKNTKKTTQSFYTTWRDPIYCARMHWIIEDDLIKAKSTAQSKARVNLDISGLQTYARSITFDRADNGIVILTREFCGDAESISTLAHELVHATNRILHDAGVRQNFGASLDAMDDEAFAYLFGWELNQALTLWGRCRH